MAQGQGARRRATETDEARYRREFAERVYRAFEQCNHKRPRGEKLSQEDLGREVARLLGERQPVPQTTVSKWMSPTHPSIPTLRTIEALAEVLAADRYWLAFGSKPG